MEGQSQVAARTLARHPGAAPAGSTLWRDLLAGARDVAGVCPGMILLGVTFGLIVVHAGLAWWWTPLFSGLIFGGSLEFLLVAMVTAAAPLAAIALTSLLVQGRHVFYALSFPLHQVTGRLRRTYAMFALTDEAYALTTTPPGQFTGTRILIMQVLMHASWVSGGVTGALAGASLHLHIPALDFAFTALFVVLAAEASLAGRRLTDPLLALGCALIARVAAPGQMLLLATVATAAVITFALRAAPFAAISRLRSAPAVAYLGQRLPVGIMIILVTYLLRGTQLTHPPFGLTELLPVAVTAAVYAWKRHMLLSMAAGTVAYALMLALLS